MTTASLPNDDGEYMALFLDLIEKEAETARLDAEELREYGFEPISVRGSPSVIWVRWDGYFTTEAALEAIEG